MQLSLAKDQMVESYKFFALSQLTLLANTLPYIKEGKRQSIQRLFEELVSSTQLFINYEEHEIEKKKREEAAKQAQMLEVVNTMTDKTLGSMIRNRSK